MFGRGFIVRGAPGGTTPINIGCTKLELKSSKDETDDGDKGEDDDATVDSTSEHEEARTAFFFAVLCLLTAAAAAAVCSDCCCILKGYRMLCSELRECHIVLFPSRPRYLLMLHANNLLGTPRIPHACEGNASLFFAVWSLLKTLPH